MKTFIVCALLLTVLGTGYAAVMEGCEPETICTNEQKDTTYPPNSCFARKRNGLFDGTLYLQNACEMAVDKCENEKMAVYATGYNAENPPKFSYEEAEAWDSPTDNEIRCEKPEEDQREDKKKKTGKFWNRNKN